MPQAADGIYMRGAARACGRLVRRIAASGRLQLDETRAEALMGSGGGGARRGT